jgi:hypothetical protein
MPPVSLLILKLFWLVFTITIIAQGCWQLLHLMLAIGSMFCQSQTAAFAWTTNPSESQLALDSASVSVSLTLALAAQWLIHAAHMGLPAS